MVRADGRVLEFAGVELHVGAGHVEQSQVVLVAPDEELAQVAGVGRAGPPGEPREEAAPFTSSDASCGSHRTSQWSSPSLAPLQEELDPSQAGRAELVNVPPLSTEERHERATSSPSRTGVVWCPAATSVRLLHPVLGSPQTPPSGRGSEPVPLSLLTVSCRTDGLSLAQKLGDIGRRPQLLHRLSLP